MIQIIAGTPQTKLFTAVLIASIVCNIKNLSFISLNHFPAAAAGAAGSAEWLQFITFQGKCTENKTRGSLREVTIGNVRSVHSKCLRLERKRYLKGAQKERECTKCTKNEIIQTLY